MPDGRLIGLLAELAQGDAGVDLRHPATGPDDILLSGSVAFNAGVIAHFPR